MRGSPAPSQTPEKGVRFRNSPVSRPAQIEQSVTGENDDAGDDRMSGELGASADRPEPPKKRRCSKAGLTSTPGTENEPTRDFNACRSNKNSIQPATPAEAGNPANPHLGSRCKSFGIGNADK